MISRESLPTEAPFLDERSHSKTARASAAAFAPLRQRPIPRYHGPRAPSQAHRHSREDPMPLFIMSMNWTEKGIKSIREWPKRLKAARDYAKTCGVTIKATYLTTGDYDLMTILEAKDGGD